MSGKEAIDNQSHQMSGGFNPDILSSHDSSNFLAVKRAEIQHEYEGKIEQEVLDNAFELILTARKDALKRVSDPENPEIKRRVDSSLGRVLPYVVEAKVIARQTESEPFKEFVRETKNFLNAEIGFCQCPDGRIDPESLTDPDVADFTRRLKGAPQTRLSSEDPRKCMYVLDDPDLAASMNFKMEKRLGENKNAESIEGVGPHIFSRNPSKGCGAATGETVDRGHAKAVGMKFGGIFEYYEELGDGFYAFNNNAEIAGGKGTTFDITPDHFTQGFFVGIRDHLHEFDKSKNLLQNLQHLQREGKILATEALDDVFAEEIDALASDVGITSYTDLNLDDPTQYARNFMLVGNIARKITQSHEQDNQFEWIPDAIRNEKSETAVRFLAYTAIRNVVYRRIKNIRPGNHDLLEHPEQLLVAGPIVPRSRKTIPFMEKTARGQFRQEDIDGVKKLYDLLEGVLENHHGADLNVEGRVIFVTGEYDDLMSDDEDKLQRERHRVAAVTKNNAGAIRGRYPDAIQNGEMIVISALVKPSTKDILSVI